MDHVVLISPGLSLLFAVLFLQMISSRYVIIHIYIALVDIAFSTILHTALSILSCLTFTKLYQPQIFFTLTFIFIGQDSKVIE